MNAIRHGWIAAQVGNRVGAIGLLASCAGTALMLAGKKPFPALLACGLAAAAIAFLASLTAKRHNQTDTRGLILFNLIVLLIATAAMLAARLNWWHAVGIFAAGHS